MASIRYLKNRKRWQVRWHITDPKTKEVKKGSKLLPPGCNRFDAEKIAGQYKMMSKEIKLGRYRPPNRIKAAFERWTIHIKRHTPRTQKHYLPVLESFLKTLPKTVINIEQLTFSHIDDYISGMLQDGKTNRTCNAHLTAIKSFCKWFSEACRIENPARYAKNLKEAPPNQRFLSPVEYQAIIDIEKEPYKNRIVFIANTGLRASEFANLTWKCVSSDYKSITIVGKGRKRRTIPLNSACQQMLRELHRLDSQPNDPIFTSNSSKKGEHGKPVSRHALHQQCKKIAEQLAIPLFGPHSLRHWFATQLIRKGIPIYHVSRLMGHASVKTTEQIYIHILPPDLYGITEVLCSRQDGE